VKELRGYRLHGIVFTVVVGGDWREKIIFRASGKKMRLLMNYALVFFSSCSIVNRKKCDKITIIILAIMINNIMEQIKIGSTPHKSFFFFFFFFGGGATATSSKLSSTFSSGISSTSTKFPFLFSAALAANSS